MSSDIGKTCTPDGRLDLLRFEEKIENRSPFTFVRFSDGEIEILRNRKLTIQGGKTEFRGKVYTNQFPDFDSKEFLPDTGQGVRSDLLEAAMYVNTQFYKGVPTAHNRAEIDREFLLRLNGGFDPRMTFSDLFLNSNFVYSRSLFFPKLIKSFDNIYVVANWRSRLMGSLVDASHVSIPDNFFSKYEETLRSVLSELHMAPTGSLILSSASSLSNVVGRKLIEIRPDLTFIDIGTVINDLLGLSLNTRAYHTILRPNSLIGRVKAFRYRLHPEYNLKW